MSYLMFFNIYYYYYVITIKLQAQAMLALTLICRPLHYWDVHRLFRYCDCYGLSGCCCVEFCGNSVRLEATFHPILPILTLTYILTFLF